MKKATARENAIRSSIAIAVRAAYWFSPTTTSAINPMIRNPRSVGRSARNLRTSAPASRARSRHVLLVGALSRHVGAEGKHGSQQGSPGEPREPAPGIRRRVDPGPGHREHGETAVHVMHPLLR